jgi:hypothetical protein
VHRQTALAARCGWSLSSCTRDARSGRLTPAYPARDATTSAHLRGRTTKSTPRGATEVARERGPPVTPPVKCKRPAGSGRGASRAATRVDCSAAVPAPSRPQGLATTLRVARVDADAATSAGWDAGRSTSGVVGAAARSDAVAHAVVATSGPHAMRGAQHCQGLVRAASIAKRSTPHPGMLLGGSASSRWWIGASTGVATTPTGWSRLPRRRARRGSADEPATASRGSGGGRRWS